MLRKVYFLKTCIFLTSFNVGDMRGDIIKKVVLYLRYSSDKQTEQSIEGQERVCLDFCNKNNYVITEKYIDRAKSASTKIEKRTSFNRMIKDSEKKEFEIVVVYKLDRFARDRYDSAIYKSKLKKNGVKLISATENITDSPEGIILESVLEGMAEFYSKELSQKVKRGMRETQLKGNFTGGVIPLGYKLENKKLVADAITSKWILDAFKRCADGEPIISIVNDFNKLGRKTTHNKPFKKNSFSNIFKNKKYIGVVTIDDHVYIRDELKIVPIDLFNKVQEKMENRKRSFYVDKTSSNYLLTKKIYCGKCGNSLSGSSSINKSNNKFYYYICSGVKKGVCNLKPTRRDDIEKQVKNRISELLTDEVIIEISKNIYNLIVDDDFNNELKEITDNIEKINFNINNLIGIVKDSGVDEIVKLELQKLSKEKKTLESNLEYYLSRQDKVSIENIQKFLFDFVRNDTQDEKNYWYKLIDLLVEKIIFYDRNNIEKMEIQLVIEKFTQ